MNKQITVQAVAFSLAAFVTFALLGSVGSVADQQYDHAVVAQAAPASTSITTLPTQYVVVTGKRIARG